MALLLKPQNIRVHSLNFKSTLCWDPVIWENNSVEYNVHYRSIFNSNITEPVEWCTGIINTCCDFTEAFPLLYRVILAVQAKAGQQTSDFATLSSYFEPVQNTSIGPPSNVHLESRSGALYVFIRDPVESVKLLPIYFKYMILYWVNNTETKWSSETTEHEAKLSNVEAQTAYCVQVVTFFQVPYERDFKKGGSSPAKCITVLPSEEDSFGYFFMPLIAFLLAFTFTAVGVFIFVKYFRHSVKWLFHPLHRIPSHLEEFLKNPEQYCISSQLEENANTSKEQIDSLSIVSDQN